jgi:hypothetical protein
MRTKREYALEVGLASGNQSKSWVDCFLPLTRIKSNTFLHPDLSIN